LPTLTLVDISPKKWLRNKNQVKFELGGKIITLNNGIVVSKESFIGDVVEIRFRFLSFIVDCVHFGIIE